MSEFNIRSDSVNVEQIMEQIRSRIKDKRGVDYTEDQIRELAGVKLERFLDPKNVRSDLLQHYRRRGENPVVGLTSESYAIDQEIIYRSSRGFVGRILYTVRRLLNPILKLFFNPKPILHALAVQKEQIDELVDRFERIAAKMTARTELDALTYEVLNNLVVEMTRLSIDVKNHKMRVESIAARLDFDERRSRALEQVVQYQSTARTNQTTRQDGPSDDAGADNNPDRRRRRRRRGRRRPAGNVSTDAKAAVTAQGTSESSAPEGRGVARPSDTPQSTASTGGNPPDTPEQ